MCKLSFTFFAQYLPQVLYKYNIQKSIYCNSCCCCLLLVSYFCQILADLWQTFLPATALSHPHPSTMTTTTTTTKISLCLTAHFTEVFHKR